MTVPELSRLVRTDTIGDDARTMEIEADADERVALTKRFDLIALDRLSATFTIRRDAQGIIADGRVQATLTQACSVTGDPLPTTIDENVVLRFVPAGCDNQEEIELNDGDLDVVAYEGSDIDLGETAAETVALAIDPFVRGPGAEAALREAGVISEDDVRPVGPFAGLKEKLAGK